jgi:hypothetical protein
MSVRIEIWQANEKWFWHVRASNGRVTSDAESFPSRSNAIRAAKRVVATITEPMGVIPLFAQRMEKDGTLVLTWGAAAGPRDIAG